MARRTYGTGSLYVKTDRNGGERWYARLRIRGRQVNRAVGPKRAAGSRDGLTRTQAEARLRKLADELDVAPPIVERQTLAQAGRRCIAHRAAMGRKRSTIEGYESILRVHLVPYFADLPLDEIKKSDIEGFVAERQRDGCAPKSIRLYFGLLHSILDYAERRNQVHANPCKHVDLPDAEDADPDIHFLGQAELDALVRAVPDTGLGITDRVLYLTAAMTGMRQGELVALRWRDVDWAAGRIRVRRSYVRGEFGTPKSKRSSRAVPLADRLATELEHHFQTSVYQSDGDLVFAHPQTGKPLERSRLLKRYKRNLERARVREVRFHDLRHTFGTRMAAAGVPLRTLQEWMGHRDFKTTLIYADYQPSPDEAKYVERAFGGGDSSQAPHPSRRVSDFRS